MLSSHDLLAVNSLRRLVCASLRELYRFDKASLRDVTQEIYWNVENGDPEEELFESLDKDVISLF